MIRARHIATLAAIGALATAPAFAQSSNQSSTNPNQTTSSQSSTNPNPTTNNQGSTNPNQMNSASSNTSNSSNQNQNPNQYSAAQSQDQNATGQRGTQNNANQSGMNSNGWNGTQGNQYGANQYGTNPNGWNGTQGNQYGGSQSGTNTNWNGMHVGNYGQYQGPAYNSGQWGNTGRASAADGVLTRGTVADIQEHLQRDGFYRQGNIDGIWGPETNQAVMNFQNAHGLRPTGTLNLQTLAALGLLNNNGYAENNGANGNFANNNSYSNNNGSQQSANEPNGTNHYASGQQTYSGVHFPFTKGEVSGGANAAYDNANNGQANNNYMGNNPNYRSNYSNNNGYSNGNGYQQSANEPNGTNHYAGGQQTYSGVHTPFARGGVNSGANAAYDNTNNNGQYNTH